MTPKGDSKKYFSPRNGVIQPSLFHCEPSPAKNRAKTARKFAETDKKRAKVKVSEHTYPVSSVCLEKNRKVAGQK
jgi:hypothetical protein